MVGIVVVLIFLQPGFAYSEVEITDEYVHATALGSCGDCGYYYHDTVFQNKCPWCHHHSLDWNPKGSTEGEWTCTHCSADFCICGQDKGHTGKWLYEYNPPPPEPVIVVVSNVTNDTPLVKMKKIFREQESKIGVEF